MQPVRLEIGDVKSHLNEWRNTRDKLGPIPEHIWAEILSLIGRYNTGTLSKELGISGQQIKNKMTEIADKEFEEVKRAHFAKAVIADEPVSSATNVVTLQPKSSSTHHDIEITRADGAVLKVTALSNAEVMSIINQFASC